MSSEIKVFPNGFRNWMETFYEVVEHLVDSEDKYPDWVKRQLDDYGRCILYDVAEEFTNEFEELNKDRVWDGEFYEEIDSFMNEKLSI